MPPTAGSSGQFLGNGGSGVSTWTTLPAVAVSSTTIFDDGALPSVDGEYWAANGTAGAGQWRAIPAPADPPLQDVFDAGQTVTIADTDNQTLTITNNDTTNDPSSFVIDDNTASGMSFSIDKDSSAGGTALRVEQNSVSGGTNVVAFFEQENTAASAAVIEIENKGSAPMILLDKNTGDSSGNGIQMDHNNSGGTGFLLNMQNTSSDTGIFIVHSGTTGNSSDGIYVDMNSTGDSGITVSRDTEGKDWIKLESRLGTTDTLGIRMAEESIGTNWVWTFPPDSGAADECLTTNGAGGLSTWTYKMSPAKDTADPCANGSGDLAEGDTFYNDTSDYLCFCDGAGDDKQAHSPATACF